MRICHKEARFRCRASAVREMAAWMAAGKLKSRQHIVEGFDTCPETFLKLFRDENIGKLLLKVADA
jgi:NADPH-dependent curcumin reductase CurA